MDLVVMWVKLSSGRWSLVILPQPDSFTGGTEKDTSPAMSETQEDESVISWNWFKLIFSSIFLTLLGSSDSFYPFDKESNTWMKWAKYNVLAVEMESNALYTLGALYNVDTLSILTVSDSLVTHESTTKEERQITFNTMALIALETLL